MGGERRRSDRRSWDPLLLERVGEPLLPRGAFLVRIARYALAAGALVVGALGIGIAGYHGFEGLPWIDALVNAAMILGGMGPVNALHTTAGKLFASAYALFAGLVFLVAAGLFFTPLFHRLLHYFHLDDDDDGGGASDERTGAGSPPTERHRSR